MNDVEIALFKKAVKGDMDAFEKLILNYEKLIYNMAYRMLPNPEDARDISQDVILKIYKNLSACKEPRAFKSWMYRIINNTCLDELRKRKGKYTDSLDAALDTGEGQMELQIPAKGPTPEEALLKNETAARVRQAILKLPEHARSLIVLRDIEGLSYEEISVIANIPMGTVKSRLARARTSLKEILLSGGELL